MIRHTLFATALAGMLAACAPVGTEPVGQAIPSALQGRWGLTAGDCIPGASDAKGLMVVSDDSLRFYESRASLHSVSERSASRIIGTFDFTGEGQQWTQTVSLDLQDGGTTLVRRVYSSGAAPGPFVYRSCS